MSGPNIFDGWNDGFTKPDHNTQIKDSMDKIDTNLLETFVFPKGKRYDRRATSLAFEERLNALSYGESFMVKFEEEDNHDKKYRWLKIRTAIFKNKFNGTKKLWVKRTELPYTFKVKFPTDEEVAEARAMRARHLASRRFRSERLRLERKEQGLKEVPPSITLAEAIANAINLIVKGK
jgi:hypothetical protein